MTAIQFLETSRTVRPKTQRSIKRELKSAATLVLELKISPWHMILMR